MKLIAAIAAAPARRVNTKYGERTVIDAIRVDDGEEITIWRTGNDEYAQKHIQKNTQITVTLDSKGKYGLVEDPNLGENLPIPVKPVHNYDHKIAQTSAKPSDSEHFFLSPHQKREIAAYIATMKDLYGYCYQQADSLNVGDEDKRAIATTLYLSAQKKFSL